MISKSKLVWITILFAVGCGPARPVALHFDAVVPSSMDGPDLHRSHPPLVTLDDYQKFDRASFEIISEKGAGAGVTGAKKVTIRIAGDSQEVTLKTKAFPSSLDGANNSPRKEHAAYSIQRFFLDPVDYVVPTVGVRCTSLDEWKASNKKSPTRVAGTECALISYAFWLNNVTLPDPLYDEQRFLTDGRYAYNLANFNILSYLVSHHDTRSGNVLVSKNDDDRRVFAIDNGTTFGAFFFNWFYPPTFAWRNIRVPALPRNAVNRLRDLKEEDLDALGVLVQLEADQDGILRVEAPGDPIDNEKGVSVRGTTVQLGLSEDEIEDVWERIEDLLEDIDDGKIGVF